jgi:hypothetical protein
MKNLILTLVITLPLTLWGQGWEQTYDYGDEDWGRSVKQTNDNGFIITGTSLTLNNSLDVILIKTDVNGNEEWTQTFGGLLEDEGRSLDITTDNGFIIIGETDYSQDSSVYVIKTDENGIEEWSQIFEGGVGCHIQQTNDGGYIMTGYTRNYINGIEDSEIWLRKIDENGNEEWGETFGGIENEYCGSVQQTTDGGYVMTGYTSSFGNGSSDFWLIKTDENGQEQWNQTYGGQSYDRSSYVQQTTDGGYIMTGRTSSFGDSWDVWLVKTDENGQEQWNETYGGIDVDKCFSGQQTVDGGYVMTGYTLQNNDCLLYLVKTDENGQEQWNQTFDSGDDGSQGWSVYQTTDNGFILTGWIYDVGNNQNILLIKTDDQGNITSTFEIPLTNTNKKLEKTVNLIGQEIKPQTNTPIIEIFDDGSVEKKLIIEK